MEAVGSEGNRVASFGRLLRGLRRVRGVTQEQLAGRANVSVRHLSWLETGRSTPSREMVGLVGRALGLGDASILFEAAGFMAPSRVGEHVDGASRTPCDETLRRLTEGHRDPVVVHDGVGHVVHVNEPLVAMVRAGLGARVSREELMGFGWVRPLRHLAHDWEHLWRWWQHRLLRDVIRGGGTLPHEVAAQLDEGWFEAVLDAAEDEPRRPQTLVLGGPEGEMRFSIVTSTIGTLAPRALETLRLAFLIPDRETTVASRAEAARAARASAA
ncbi:MAG: helix-turn-helix transcriptional regulator [Myxococcota bacterium]